MGKDGKDGREAYLWAVVGVEFLSWLVGVQPGPIDLFVTRVVSPLLHMAAAMTPLDAARVAVVLTWLVLAGVTLWLRATHRRRTDPLPPVRGEAPGRLPGRSGRAAGDAGGAGDHQGW
jgi:hypothetical protein